MTDETHRVACESCGAKILPATAELYDGYCAPCHKRLNATPPAHPTLPPQSLIDKIAGFLIPIGFIALFLVGIPLGYKLILGGRKTTVESGTIRQITLVHPIAGRQLEGRPARIVPSYVVVELETGHKLWIPDDNVAGIEFLERD